MEYLTKEEQTELSCIYRSQGLSAAAACSCVQTLVHWSKFRGIAWVVERLKLMRRALITRNSTGIKCHPNGEWFGSFRSVYRLAMRGRRYGVAADRILRIYTRWHASAAQEADYIEFERKLNSTVDSGCATDVDDLVIDYRSRRFAKQALKQACFNLNLPCSEKRTPLLGKPESATTVAEHFRQLLVHCPALLRDHLDFFDEYVLQNQQQTKSFYAEALTWARRSEDVVGKVVCLTKDGGLKKRFIANPLRFLQMATSRLQSALDLYLQLCPESLVHDQSKSESWVVEQLGKGRRMFSLDLSSATDHFPLDLQLRVVYQLFPELARDISLWEDVSVSLWETPYRHDIRYKTGQPMGVAPSFAAFTVTHLHLIRHLGGNHDNFRIIGDDVVISCPDLATRYISMMCRLGVTVNLSKSIMDAEICEFAGRLIDKHGYWHSFKAKKLTRVDPLGAYRQYGPRGSRLLPKYVTKVLDVVSKMPLIGPRSCWDWSMFNNIDPVTLYGIYGDPAFADPYPVQTFFKGQSVFSVPLTAFEKAGLHAGFRGNVGVANPRQITDHVNANFKEGRPTDHIVLLSRSLERGAIPHQPKVSKDTLRFYRRVARAIGSALPTT